MLLSGLRATDRATDIGSRAGHMEGWVCEGDEGELRSVVPIDMMG
jgi:hypothetical protein